MIDQNKIQQFWDECEFKTIKILDRKI